MGGLVLVVDDDPVARHILSSVMRSAGYEVETAQSGAECLSFFSRSLAADAMPIAMFLDMHLDDMTGSEILLEVRRLCCDRLVPVILLSANTEEELRQDHPELDPDLFLEKPFTPASALAALEQVLRAVS